MIVKTNYLEILKSVANYMLDNIGNILSTNNVANTMTSNGRIRIALKYIEGLIESFFFYRANRYDIKGKQYLKHVNNIMSLIQDIRYFILGRNVGNHGHILENVVYLDLIRRGYDVYVGKIDEYDVDFVAINNNGKIMYIQVCDTLKSGDNSTYERELNSLRKINNNYSKMILSMDKIPFSNEEGIIVKNALDWLLDK